MSVPPGTEMFQFPGFASTHYVFMRRYPLPGGLPHSDIHGSKPARGSPWLFAACHVLHRLLMPRHPPNALILLEITIVLALARNSLPTMHRNHPRPSSRPDANTPATPQATHSANVVNASEHNAAIVGCHMLAHATEPVRRMPTATCPETHQNLIDT